ALTVLEADVEIVDARGRADRASRMAEAPQDDPDRTVFLHGLGRDVLALGRRALLGRRKRDPQLVEAQRLALEGAAVVPHAVAGFHPFQSARNDLAFLSGGVLVEDAAGKHCGEGRNARVRMNSGEQPLSRRTNFAVIQENERLNQLADVGRADEAGDRAMPAAAGAKSDTALAGAYRWMLQGGHLV